MPLLPPVLANELIKIDATASPKNTVEAAHAWSKAWWSYASGCVFLFPASLEASKLLATTAFTGIMLAAFAPVPAPPVFFLALEGAMRAAWGTLSTPASLTPPLLSITPAPIPFVPMGLAVVPVGLAAPAKEVSRTLLATVIHAWTITHIVVGPSGPVGPLS